MGKQPRVQPLRVTAALVVALSAAFVPAAAMAQSAIPGLSEIPKDLGPGEGAQFAARRQALEAQLAVFEAAAKGFNDETAEAQSDAEYAALQAQRSRYIQAANAFNRDLAAAAASEPNRDSSVVDARHVPSGLPKDVDDAIASGYGSAPSGVSDRVRKGFQAIATHDWKVARAWFQDALNHDPGNLGLKRLAELADYTQKRREHDSAAKIASSSSSLLQLPEPDDIRLLISDLESAVAKPAAAPGNTPLQLPKQSDIEFLFPGLPVLQAKELEDYFTQDLLKSIQNDPEMIRLSSPPAPKLPHN